MVTVFALPGSPHVRTKARGPIVRPTLLTLLSKKSLVNNNFGKTATVEEATEFGLADCQKCI